MAESIIMNNIPYHEISFVLRNYHPSLTISLTEPILVRYKDGGYAISNFADEIAEQRSGEITHYVYLPKWKEDE